MWWTSPSVTALHMGSSRRGPPGIQFALPPLLPWLRNTLIALLGVYVLELILVNFMGLPLYRWLAWSPSIGLQPGTDGPLLTPRLEEQITTGLAMQPFGGLEPGDIWQPATQFLVQGLQPFNVLLNLLMLYFFLPFVVDRFTRVQLVQIFVALVVGCAAAGWAWAGITWLVFSAGWPVAIGWLVSPGMGLSPIIFAIIALFALANPDRTINMFFVLPLKASWLLWIDLGIITLTFLAQPGVGSFQEYGGFLGIVAWWFLIGPGRSRRRFKRAGKDIERDLKFKVYTGGRQKGGNNPDEWVN